MNMGTVVNLRICESVVEIGTNIVLTLSIFAWRPRNISKPCWGTGDPGPCGLIDGDEYQMLNRPHAFEIWSPRSSGQHLSWLPGLRYGTNTCYCIFPFAGRWDDEVEKMLKSLISAKGAPSFFLL